MNGLQHAGAFVLQFREETDFAAGRVTGRVEHVASGQTARFESVDELLATLARLLAEAQAGERQSER